MEDYLHRVVGLYPDRASAESARDDLLAQGLAPHQLRLLVPGAAAAGQDAASDSDDVLKDLLRDGAIGTAVGTAVGAGATIALAAANITLFIASPVLGALSMLGWGAGLGGLVGAVVGSERRKGDVPGLIRDALASGQFVLVAHAGTEEQATQARRTIGESMVDAERSSGIGVVQPVWSPS
jgi:hypothetical protein